VSGDALALAVLSIIRPTTAAAVWAMLVSTRPRRLIGSYLLAGLAVSLTVGIVVVLAAGQLWSPRELASSRGGVLVVLGVVALLMSAAVGFGWVPRFRLAPAAERRPRALSPVGAAVAGVVTHLPGVFYLAGLSAIVATGAAAAGSTLQVVVYNVIWFSPAIVALGVCVFGTVPSAERTARIASRVRAHQTAVLTVCSGVVGIWLIAEGISDIL
jgi:Sap, sulfolipid-1-addressing protein